MSPHTPVPDPLHTVLHALRSAEPAPGFEGRLHARLQAAAHTLTEPRPTRRILLIPPFLASAALVLLAFFVPRPHAPHPASTRPAATTPAASASHSAPPAALAPSSANLRPTVRRKPHPQPSLAAQETTAPSLTPPPLETTAEERDIQRFRSLHSAVSLAALSPQAISAHHTADQHDLDLFFNPPPSEANPASQEN